MGGPENPFFRWFTALCCKAYNVLRKNANLFINLFAMVYTLQNSFFLVLWVFSVCLVCVCVGGWVVVVMLLKLCLYSILLYDLIESWMI